MENNFIYFTFFFLTHNIIKFIRSGHKIVSQKGLEPSKKTAQNFGWKPGTDQLNIEKWEVIVMDSYISNALYLPDGKTNVSTGTPLLYAIS